MPALTGTAAGGAPPARLPGVGVLGCAEIARRRFLPALAGSRRVRPAAVASRDPGRAAALAGPLGCRAEDYAGLIRSDDVDLIYVPTPNGLHEEWVLAALDHGKHVLCEKPLGLTARSVDRMVAAAERSGLLLFENLMYLQHPQHAAIGALLAAGRIGEVTGLDCAFHIPMPAAGNVRLDPSLGGGAFQDLNRYPLSAAALLLAGEVAEIGRCTARRQGGVDVSMVASATTTRGEHFGFSIAFGLPYQSYLEVRGTGGTLRLERAFTPPPEHGCRLEIRDARGVEVRAMPAADQFRLTLDHVAELISGGGPFPAEHARARALAATAERFLASAGAGREGP